MKRIYPLLIWGVILQLTVAVEVGFCRIALPSEPTRAFGNGWISQIAYSPDGQILAVSGRDGTFLHDAETLSRTGHLPANSGSISAIAISPDSKWLASGDIDGIVQLWDLTTREPIAIAASHDFSVNSVDFSPDGAYLVSSSTNATAYVWDIKKREQVADFEDEIRGSGNSARKILFSPDGRWIAIDVGSKVLLFDSETQQLRHTLRPARSPVFSADGQTLLYLASTDPHRDPIFRTDLKFWDIKTQREIAVVEDVKETHLSASANRDWIASFDPWSNTPIRLWDTFRQKEITQFPINAQVKSLSFHPNTDRFAIVTGGTTIAVWDVATQKSLIQRETHTGIFRFLAISPDGKLFAAVHEDHSIRLWDTDQGIEQKRWTGRRYDYDILAFSPDGRRVVAGDSQVLEILDVETGTPRSRFSFEGPKRVVFRPDGKRIYAINDAMRIKGWDLEEGRQILDLQGEDPGFRGWPPLFAVSSDGNFFAVSDDYNARKDIFVWDVQKRKLDLVLRGYQRGVNALAFSPTGHNLAFTDGEGTLFLWDIKKNREIVSYPHPNGRYGQALTFSPNGTYLIWQTPIPDRTRKAKITVFDWKDGTEIGHIISDRMYYNDFVLSEKGTRLITLGRQILLWKGDFGSPVSPAGKHLTLFGNVKQTTLFANYPNPFNPETWIPYHLGVDASVRIEIYTPQGDRVRTLTLGVQPAGWYLTKDEAAYWNGRNEAGELVSSGVYFYHLIAGDFESTRKLLVRK